MITTEAEYRRRAYEYLKITPEVEAIAVDRGGEVYWYTKIPTRTTPTNRNCWGSSSRYNVMPFRVHQDIAKGFWRASLVIRPKTLEELYPVDTLVHVCWEPSFVTRVPRYSAGTVDSHGRLMCWRDGCTSETVGTINRTTAWYHVMPYDDRECQGETC